MKSPTNSFKRPCPKGGKYLFFSTGTPDLLINGIEVDLKMNYTPAQCKDYLKNQLQGKVKGIDKFDLLVYLAGGIPFLKGTLEDIYKKGPKVQPYI